MFSTDPAVFITADVAGLRVCRLQTIKSTAVVDLLQARTDLQAEVSGVWRTEHWVPHKVLGIDVRGTDDDAQTRECPS